MVGVIGTTEASAGAGALVLALCFAAVLIWVLVRSWKQRRRDRAFREYREVAQRMAAESTKEIEETNCRHCGENITRVPQMYRVGKEMVCLKCLQTLEKTGWGALARYFGVYPVMVRKIMLTATAEGIEEEEMRPR